MRIAASALMAAATVTMTAALAGPQPASPLTEQSNAAWLNKLPFADRADFEDARRGLVARFPQRTITTADGRVVWDFQAYAFESAASAPNTVNPSLWRLAQLNNEAGLFKVTDRVYQIRGADLANMNIIEGDSGLIIIDTLLTAETARAALDLYYAHRPRKPVVAVIYTHSHADHFGGVRGIVDEADVKSGKVDILPRRASWRKRSAKTCWPATP